MRVIVCGAAGFIGSNLVERCLAEGWDVTAVDDLSSGHACLLPERVRQSTYLTDLSAYSVRMLVQSKTYDAVALLAAIPRVSYSVENPMKTHEVNVTRTMRLIDECRGNIGTLVFASSSSVYGGADVLPTPETYPTDPKSPYALQKLIIEQYLRVYGRLYGLSSTSLRLFNVIGRNCLGGSAYSTALSAWLKGAISGQALRSDGDGTQSRDLCHVDNVTQAFVLAMKKPAKVTEVYNVGTSERITNNEVLEMVKERYHEALVINAPFRVGDVPHTCADTTKIRTDLGFKVEKNIRQGIESTIEWALDSDFFRNNTGRL